MTIKTVFALCLLAPLCSGYAVARDGGLSSASLTRIASGSPTMTRSARGAVRLVPAPAQQDRLSSITRDLLDHSATMSSATVEGFVFMKSSGVGVTSAVVRLVSRQRSARHYRALDELTTSTDATGAFRFEHVPAGSYSMVATKGELLTFPENNSLSLAEGETTGGIQLQLYPGHTITGRVIEYASKQPVPGTTVTVNLSWADESRSSLSDASGVYSLTRIAEPIGTRRTLHVEKPGYDLADVRDPFLDWNHEPEVTLERTSERISKDILLARLLHVSGHVRNPEGAPLAGAHVHAVHALTQEQLGQEVVADSAGQFELELAGNRCLRVRAEAAGYAPECSGEIALADQPTTGIELVLQRGATLRGHVVDAEGAPIAQAQISAESSATQGRRFQLHLGRTNSDSSGVFALRQLPGKPLVLTARKSGFGEAKLALELTTGETRSGVRLVLTPSESTATQNRRGQPAPGSSTPVADVVLYGTVLDGATEAAVRDFRILAPAGHSIIVDPAVPGKFMAKGLTRGTSCHFYIEAHGYAPLAETVVLPADQASCEKTFKLGSGGTIRGRIVDRDTRQPVSQVQIMLWPHAYNYGQTISADARTFTGADGRFELGHLPELHSLLFIRPPQPYVDMLERDVVANATAPTDLGDIEVTGGASIFGKLVRSPGDVPITGAAIIIGELRRGLQQVTQTDANGAYRVSGLLNDWHGVSVPDYGLATDVYLSANESHELLLRVGSASLRGRVLLGDQPCPAQVTVTQGDPNAPDYQWLMIYTEANGAFEANGLPPGRWQIRFSPTGNPSLNATEYIELQNGQSVDRDFRLSVGQIAGRVLAASGEPVAGAQVVISATATDESIRHSASGLFRTSTLADGSFTVGGLGLGSYSVSAAREGAGSAFEGSVVLTAESASRQLVLTLGQGPTGTIVSTALDMSGRPLTTAWCEIRSSAGRFGHSAKRDSNGVMQIPDVPAGTYQVQVSARDYSISEHTVSVEPGQTVEIRDVLYGAGSLQWTLVRRDGTPVAGARVEVVPDDPSSIEAPRTAATNAQGVLFISGLAPGSYTATAALPGNATVRESFQVTFGGVFGPNDRKQTVVD